MKNLTAMKWIWPLQLTIKRLKRRKEKTISSKKYTRSPVRADPVTGTLSDWTQHVAIPKGWFLWIWKEKPELQEQAAPKMCQPVFLLELCIRFTGDWRANRMEVESGTGRQPNYFRKNGNKKTPDFRDGKLAHQGWLLLCWITWNGNADFGSCLPVKETRLFWQM